MARSMTKATNCPWATWSPRVTVCVRATRTFHLPVNTNKNSHANTNTNMASDLSCQTRVLGDAVVFIPEEARVREAIVRKAAGKPIAVRDPVTRKYFSTVPAPTLEDHRGDWERLRDALKAEHNINVAIDFTTLKQLSDIAKPQRAKVMH
jgi:uncharacterized 2Fe-2S/4Fe-4S cluster protein (DUF4445 family)